MDSDTAVSGQRSLAYARAKLRFAELNSVGLRRFAMPWGVVWQSMTLVA
jgi:hypothetical protein